MFLTEIKVQGFKSFVNNTKITFDQQITGIVGPNGSGKSNIVDAIRWVLGEQSVKSLRGNYAMTDVIFSGTKEKAPANMASVALVFNNNDRILSIDNKEVEIKRKVYRDGENEYFLNNTKCRLKDITDLLLESNLAKESFNIIGQGKIEEIITNKAADRKVVFEEAAGVLKYKKRKEETLRKLEKTNDNINRIQDIIIEVEARLKSLGREKGKALRYKKLKSKLDENEVGLLVHDISNMSYRYENLKKEFKNFEEKALILNNDELVNTNDNEKQILENLKTELHKLQNNLFEKITEAEKLNSKKQIILERKKYQVEDQKLQMNAVVLKEKKLEFENQLSLIKQEETRMIKQLEALEITIKNLNKDFNEIEENKNQIQIRLAQNLRQEQGLKNQIETRKNNLENNSYMPISVLKIINNQTLPGIIGALGNLIEVDEKYSRAIAVSLGAATNNVIVNNEESAKIAINFLKDNNLGRVTFLPKNIIKANQIDETLLNRIKNMAGFIDIANNLVKCETKIQNIIDYYFGTVLVVNNLENANQLAKELNYRYRIVTLDGELLSVGGAISGGKHKFVNTNTEKYELEQNLRSLLDLEKTIQKDEEKINELDATYRSFEKDLYIKEKERATLHVKLNNFLEQSKKINEEITIVDDEITGVKSILDNTLDQEEQTLIDHYYQVVKEKDEINHLILMKEKEKDELEALLEKKEADFRVKNKELIEITKQAKDVEVEINRLDVKLENDLEYLSKTYNMTYEYAANHFHLADEPATVRELVENLKTKLANIGFANLNAPEEYDEIDMRYQFLNNQKEDLKNAASNLIKTIEELDKTMEQAFIKTFNEVQKHFQVVFKELFKGGEAYLELTDPKNILETGVEIIAQPPGKKLTTLNLLSGGEKALTAISLLFAILKTKPVSFCVFDEVEAALDEVNVQTFGEYITKLKDKTQFIIVTHKKKTMEYADLLYGITMQESGVSKLVSIRLSDLN